LGSYCHPCNRAVATEWRLENIDRHRTTMRRARLRRLYSLTPEEYESILDRQRGTCALCPATVGRPGTDRRLAVDHDHKTGHVRGLLCDRCNRALASLGDDTDGLGAAFRYVRDRAKGTRRGSP
jgi:hypothetical protein